MQPDKISKLDFSTTQKDFASNRALAGYIGHKIRPDECASVQLIEPGSGDTTDEEFKILLKIVTFIKYTTGNPLCLVPAYLSTAKLFLYCDASFSNA